MRRVEQFINILLSKNLTDSLGYYQDNKIHKKYLSGLVQNQMEEFELEALKDIQLHQKTILVLGSGVGREVHYFQKFAKKVIGIEPIQELIDQSYKANNVTYKKGDHRILSQLNEEIDFLWITNNLPSLIVPKMNRDIFFDDLAKLIRLGTKVFIAPDIMVLSIFDRFFWVSLYFTLFKKHFRWGDTLRANFELVPMNQLMYYHYYTSLSFENELNKRQINFKKINTKYYILG